MNATTQIYRGIEDMVTPEIEKDPLIEKIIKHLKKFIFENDFWFDSAEYKKLMKKTYLLNPSQILTLTRYMQIMPVSWKKINYLNLIIQKSYEAKNNDFIIDNIMEANLVRELHGTPENILKIKMLSNAGNDLGLGSSFCNITAEKNVKSTGTHMQNCFVEVMQNLEYLSGAYNINTIYKIHGEIKEIVRRNEFSKTKIILNKSQYKYWKPIEKYHKGLSIELMEE